METKNALVRRLVKEERYKEALQICKDWYYANPHDRETLRMGYACLMYPNFYQQLGKDPESEYKQAINTLKFIYGD